MTAARRLPVREPRERMTFSRSFAVPGSPMRPSGLDGVRAADVADPPSGEAAPGARPA